MTHERTNLAERVRASAESVFLLWDRGGSAIHVVILRLTLGQINSGLYEAVGVVALCSQINLADLPRCILSLHGFAAKLFSFRRHRSPRQAPCSGELDVSQDTLTLWMAGLIRPDRRGRESLP
jgi:hypothetical protein